MVMAELPRVEYAHIGGSGTWGFPYPDGALEGHPYLSVRVVEPDIRVETPYGPSPSFRLCRLADSRTGAERDLLYVWMHGLAFAGGDPRVQATERVFDVLSRAGVRRVFVDNSTGGVGYDLDPWDLCVVGDVIDFSWHVPRPADTAGLLRFYAPGCPALSARLAASARDRLPALRELGGLDRLPRVKEGAVYVHSFGPWFESPHEDRIYRQLGIDVVGKTGGPEFRLARTYRMCLGMLSIVVNPAEGLGDFEHGDLRAIYEVCGPSMARMVLEAIAADDPADPCRCGEAPGLGIGAENAKFAVYRPDGAY
jgi:5'-methylthioadenosine phosphorylase